MDFNNSINITHSLYLDYGYFLTKNNLAEVLGVSLSTIDRRLKEKKLPLHKKIGSRVLFPVSSVANFIYNIKDYQLADVGGEL